MAYNINAMTGIAFGIIRADHIDPELWDELTMHNGTDETYKEALAEHLRQARAQHESAVEAGEIEEDEGFDEDVATQEFNDSYESQEPVYSGIKDDVHYLTTWLGGAPLMYITKSPLVTKCAVCSPCVPNAGDLDNFGDYRAYGAPADWLTEDFVKEVCESAGFEFTNGGVPHFWRRKGNDRANGGPFAFEKSSLDDCYRKNLQESADALEGDSA